MLSFQPAFRLTENEATGDTIVHYEDGVQGYILAPVRRYYPSIDQTQAGDLYLARFEDGDYRDLTDSERADLATWVEKQGWTLPVPAARVLRREPRVNGIIFTRDEADGFAILFARWSDRASVEA